MARTAQISKEKQQSIITLRHEGQSMRNISRTLNVSSSAVAKTIKCYDETGSHEECHRKGRPRVTSAAEDTLLELPASEIVAQINASEFK
jgi:transposase